ncbi:ABC transporter substrate-binding protein [Candidatus Spongiihabitans sp.]|uniref:ABC transporter substrate-binding protein n=1 Tax=Candidatus Spongiihabitans sp. TaxID=3101308 RepID=UPI003C701A07
MSNHSNHLKPCETVARETLEKFNRLQSSFENGKVNRRNFMAGALALGFSMTAASALLNKAEAATPKKGGQLRTALTGGATSDVLDPGQILDLYMISVQFGQLRNGLTEVAAEGNLIPELAESWESSPDAKTWSFKIRQGVEFHNGKTLDSRDVVDSLNHHLGEASTSAAKGILNGIVSVKADGKNAVVVELSGGDADFPFILSDYHLGICPSNGDGAIDWQSGTGTGGYSLVEHEAGVRTLTKRNPNYWKADKAHFDENETLQIPDANSRTNALRTDAVDCMNNVEVKTVKRLMQVEGIKVVSTTGNKQITLPMRTDIAPFDDNNVRLAIKHIVDREQWLQKIAYGYGELGNDNPIGPANIYRATTEEIPQRAYDPDKARSYLKKAGMDSLKIKFHASETGFGGAVDAAQLMQESARPAGIDIEVVREPDDGYWSNVWMQKPWVACYWSGRPTENWMFSQIYAADAKWNDTYWKHDRFNQLLLQGRAELDEKKRREIYVEMQQIVHNEGGVALPLFLSDVHAHTDKVKTPEVIGANWELDGAKNAERWWFA